MSVPSNRVNFEQVMQPLIQVGGPMFGRETKRPKMVLAPITPEGKVEVGPLTVKDYQDAPCPASGAGNGETVAGAAGVILFSPHRRSDGRSRCPPAGRRPGRRPPCSPAEEEFGRGADRLNVDDLAVRLLAAQRCAAQDSRADGKQRPPGRAGRDSPPGDPEAKKSPCRSLP